MQIEQRSSQVKRLKGCVAHVKPYDWLLSQVSSPQIPPALRLELQLGTLVAKLVAQDRCLVMNVTSL